MKHALTTENFIDIIKEYIDNVCINNNSAIDTEVISAFLKNNLKAVQLPSADGSTVYTYYVLAFDTSTPSINTGIQNFDKEIKANLHHIRIKDDSTNQIVSYYIPAFDTSALERLGIALE